MTEKEKMSAGTVYSAVDAQLLEELDSVKETIHRYNAMSPADKSGRLEILKGLLGHIGDDCFIGPNVSIYTACHSTDPAERNTRNEWAEPVTIGAGSVVTKDIPSGVVAAGNPCRIIKQLYDKEGNI